MAPDSDEEEIWNYQVKATPRNKGASSKEKSIEQDAWRETRSKDITVKSVIVIDSDDDDAFNEKINKRVQQQTKQWKFLTDKSLEQSANDCNSKLKTEGGKKTSLVSSSSQRKKLPKKSFKNSVNLSRSLKKDEEQSSEPSSSQNSLKDYYSPSKQRHYKRKSSESDVLICSEDDSCDQDMKHNFQEKKSFLSFGNECQDNFLNSSPGKSIPMTMDLEENKCENKDNVSHSPEAPPVVDVFVLQEDSCHSSQSETESFDRDDQEKLPGGFVIDGEVDLFEEASESDEEKSNAGDVPRQTTSCPENPSLQNGTETKSLPSLQKSMHSRSSDYLDVTKATFDALYEPKTLSPLKAQKQTSLYSFFKARSTSSIEKPSSGVISNIDPIKAVYGQISSRPALRSHSSSPASLFCQNKTTLIKSLSDTAPQSTTQQQTQDSGRSHNRNNRQCPFYKKIPGTNITVDAFRYGVIPGCQAYFLTHFHYDHYGGLTKKFNQPIFCSQVTGNLVERRLGVNDKWINRLPMWKPCQVADATLTLMEANHCPGAVIVLFVTKDGKKILHTGDFRACPEMENYPMIKSVVVDELYLDTTYCNPSYSFPNQKEVINFVLSVVEKHVEAHPKTLIVCGAYTIGKEKIFLAIAKALNSKICVMNDKKKVLDCLQDQDLKSRLTMNWSEGQVHVLPMGRLNLKSLSEHHQRHSHFTSILAFEPTGWTHSSKSVGLDNLRPKWSSNAIILYGVPYSEHSSFTELKRFVQFLGPKKILPTVNNGNPASRKKMEDIFRAWEKEKRDAGAGVLSAKGPSHHQPMMDLWMK